MLTPCRSKVAFVFGPWSPAEARSWPFFIFRLPAEAKSQLFKFVDMLTPCRSKVTFVFGTWSPAEARSWPFYIFRLPAIFFDSLQKQSHSYLNLLICWPPAEARSHLFLALDPLQKQGLDLSLLFDSLQKQSHNYSSGSSAEARSPHFFSIRNVTLTKSVSLSLLNFYFDNMNFSKIFILSCKT